MDKKLYDSHGSFHHGAIGNIAGSFAISFLIYDETGSVLASALTFAIGLIPGFVIPLVASPWISKRS